ncbi:hypothetical protein [Alicyclobacillus sp. SO9]|uniref:hypothetical protein n=1 Tax=Alicyclobacillus sp. SO9 TaxID=2665646 RepID=UPI0018E7EC6C|nr:hypothetical protein [Alicyclobacillus sp. SO9]QQE77966.1 hypothetical protein GI364_18950 [Alicyclobacillus sp. SO9]
MTKQIPDTLTLEERAKLAVNAAVGLADHEYGFIPFFSGNLIENPASMQHGDWDYGSTHGRLIDALILARNMSGSSLGDDIEKHYRENFMSFFAEDGLSYRREHPHGHWKETANLIDQRSVLLALTSWYMSTKDENVKQAADAHVAALKRITVKEKDVWYYPASEYTKDGWPSANAVQLRLAPDPASFSGRLIMPLLKYHELTGNGDALELCHYFVNLIVHRSGVFNEDGSFNSALAYRSGHFHTRLGTLDGLARFALFKRDHSLSAFVKKSYDWALSQSTSFGWTPGDMQEQRYEHETCSLVDLISTGISLARAGYTEYWSVVERFLRNHLTESQLIDLDWVKSADSTANDEAGWRTHFQVGERLLGAFAGYSAPNDYACDVNYGRGHINDVQACCIGSGTRGLFLGWRNIVTEDNGAVSVNLLLNRGSKWLDVMSYLPHEGKVELQIHEGFKWLHIRIPKWAGYSKVKAVRMGAGESAVIEGAKPSVWMKPDYFTVSDVRAGEKITVTFPLLEETTIEYAVGQEFRVTWRGDDVVHISPEGEYRPFYNHKTVSETAPLKAGDLHRVEDELDW